jgi:hypothetical protein
MPVEEAKAILPDAIYLPPAGQADLLSVVTTHRPEVIGLIDGVFSQSLSVWHKEILYALEQGIRVYGSSSMGALRAVETDVFGMVGVGRIYELFKNGTLNDDDEVALVYSEDGDQYINISIPMVNVRATVERAVIDGIIGHNAGQKIVAIAKSLFYPERMFPLIFRRAAESGISADVIEKLKAFVSDYYVDIKKQDAIKLLELIRDLPESLPPLEVDFELTRSHVFEALYDRDRTVRHNGDDVHLDTIASHVALHRVDFTLFNANALNRALVLVLADLLQVQIKQQAIDDEARRFRIRLHLKSSELFATWLNANDLSEQEFQDFMKEQALCRVLHRWLVTTMHLKGSVKVVLDALRLENQYAEWAGKAARQEAILKEHYPLFLQTDHSSITIEKLLYEHFQATDCKMDVHYPIWLEEAGFEGVQHLWLEMLRAKLARDWVNGNQEQPASAENSASASSSAD